MLDASRSDIDKREGSVTYDLLGPAAIELEMVYSELDAVLDKGFVLKLDGTQSAYGEYLERRAAEFGITRKPAVKAVGSVTFTGTDGTYIPVGLELSTQEENPVYFVTTSDGTITNGTLTLAAQAKEGGVAGNVPAGKIVLTSGNITGITSVTNPQPFDGGIDAESDEDLLGRYLDRVRKPATSGNAAAYRQWALERPGVGDAKVYPLWNGNGTVKVVIIDSERTPPPQTVIDDVAAYIESVRPIGATVTVEGAVELPINVSATLTLKSGYTAAGVKPTIETRIVEYLKSIAFKDEPVRLSRIANIILDTEGVIDYASLTINGGTGNIVVPDGQVAVKGTVTLT
ncbi:baseplate J/gp47 family protein [Brevibacillus sp. SYP-B805]|nr:baseplate J/gp47 family protein [Brevibacillus sp. SYP-B805]NGQ95509.1 baseplate J/gp47 family protein [Brevibacillus sp. SYP-B805]